MAALTQNRDTKQKGRLPVHEFNSFPVKAGVKIYKGALVVLNAGYLAPATVATTLISMGRAEEFIDNTGSAVDGQDASGNPLECPVTHGSFLWANSAAGDLIAQTEVGKACYIVNDQTVAKTDGGATRSIAGKVTRVEAAGVWVESIGVAKWPPQ